MRSFNGVFADRPTTIFTVMSALAIKHNAVNLGQGFPDGEGPDWIRKRAAEALLDGPNQYPPMTGIPELRQSIAQHNKRFYGLDIDPNSEVIVTSGATEALADCFLALLTPGDEAIILEPAYDSYAPMIEASGATPIFVKLTPPNWEIDFASLEGAFSDRTKLVVINSPHNPIGRVLSDAALEKLATLLEKHDALAVCDEVYEHIIFDQAHLPLMCLPGMRKRAIRIGSAGKTFSLTGWKVGYITADKELAEVIAKAHQYVTFTTLPATQIAVAEGLQAEQVYFDDLAKDLKDRRDFLASGLEGAGFSLLPCDGTYFLTADISAFGYSGTDFEFCCKLTEEAGVAAVPISSFYAEESEDVPQHYIRFCFAKDFAVLEEAIKRLKEYAVAR